MPTQEITEEYFRSTARYYDSACAADTRLKDIPFYLEAAKSAEGRVLEVGCWTGRVLLPIARQGVQIDGLDFSPAFLAILREKLGRETPAVQANVSLYEGDMRTVSLGKKYELITNPFRPLQHLFSVQDQLAAFRCFNAHLNAGGRVAFNVFYPNFKVLDEVGRETVELEWVDPADHSITVRRSFLRQSVDKLNQFFEGEFIFRSYRSERLIAEERSKLRMSYYTYPQVLLLLKSTGFKVEEEYGSFDKEPISVCKEMIFIAVKE
jgi:SAM-dependent methyltransferase